MRKLFYRAALAPFLLFFALSVQASTWVLDNDNSRVIFKYSYSGTPYHGEFTNIDAVFDIDPLSPGSCNFSVTIPIADINVDDEETMSYLLDVEMFDVDQFPTATFKAEKCRLESLDSFVADGTLTIRDQTHPISFPFDLKVETRNDKIGFRLNSTVTILRLEYGVGQGYLANTSAIPNEVEIEIDVYAVMK